MCCSLRKNYIEQLLRTTRTTSSMRTYFNFFFFCLIKSYSYKLEFTGSKQWLCHLFNQTLESTNKLWGTVAYGWLNRIIGKNKIKECGGGAEKRDFHTLFLSSGKIRQKWETREELKTRMSIHRWNLWIKYVNLTRYSHKMSTNSNLPHPWHYLFVYKSIPLHERAQHPYKEKKEEEKKQQTNLIGSCIHRQRGTVKVKWTTFEN